MINVEGDYDEIVEWLDDNPLTPVRHTHSHGILTDVWDEELDALVRLNVGLFSLCHDHDPRCQCSSYKGMQFHFQWYYHRPPEFGDIDDYKEIVF